MVTVEDVYMSELYSGELIDYYKRFGTIEQFVVVSLKASEEGGVVKIKYASPDEAERAQTERWKVIRQTAEKKAKDAADQAACTASKKEGFQTTETLETSVATKEAEEEAEEAGKAMKITEAHAIEVKATEARKSKGKGITMHADY